MKKIVIGVLAHVDSGKTTLSEALLYQSGNISKLGRVDHRDSFLDTFSLEFWTTPFWLSAEQTVFRAILTHFGNY